LASIYQEGLSDRFIKPVVANDFEHVYHIYNIRHPERDRLKAYLQEQKIGTEIHYPVPPHYQKALRDMNHMSFPISSLIHETTLSLPCSFAHNVDQIQRVVAVLNKFG
jgi:dTDP-4-amino-4,6-dideoxygalactose transaminase